MDLMRFDGRVALVTGAGRGMGRAHALLLAERGAKVVVNDIGVSMAGQGEDGNPADLVVAEIEAAGGAAIADRNDVSTEHGATAMVQAAVDHFGRIDIVVHNAGIVTFIPFAEMSYEQYRRLVSVHQDGGFLVAKAAWPYMVAQNYGRLIFIVSGATMATLSHYAAAKAALSGFARGLAEEGTPHNIRVNALSVMAYTRMMSGYFHEGSEHVDIGMHGQSDIENWWREHLRSEQVSAAVAWLGHERCAISGETLITGGGWVARQYLEMTPGFAHVDLTPEMIEDYRDAVLGVGAGGPTSVAAGLESWFRKIVEGGAPLPPAPRPPALRNQSSGKDIEDA